MRAPELAVSAARTPRRAWLRPGPAGGIAFIAIIAVSFLPGIPPGVDASSAHVADWFVGKRSEILAADYITGFALFAFAWFLGGVAALLRRAEGPDDGYAAVAMIGGTAFVAMTLLGVALFNAIAFNVAEEGDLAVVRGMWDLLHFVFVAGGFGIAILVAAVSAAVTRIAGAPWWLARGGWALTALWLLAGVAMLFDNEVLGPGGVLWGAAFVGFSGWVLAVSALMAVVSPAGSRTLHT